MSKFIGVNAVLVGVGPAQSKIFTDKIGKEGGHCQQLIPSKSSSIDWNVITHVCLPETEGLTRKGFLKKVGVENLQVIPFIVSLGWINAGGGAAAALDKFAIKLHPDLDIPSPITPISQSSPYMQEKQCMIISMNTSHLFLNN